MAVNNLTKNATLVLAVLADAAPEGESVPSGRIREGSRLGGILYMKALKELEKELVERDENGLKVTEKGRNFVAEHASDLLAAVASLSPARNEVNQEGASLRTTFTVRTLLLGAAGLLFVVVALAAMFFGDTSRGHRHVEAMKWWYFANLVIIFGLVVVGGTFAKMNRGIRQQNLKAVGITLVAVLASLLAMWGDGALDSALGILGAIAGYLFGKDRSSDDAESPTVENDAPSTPAAQT